MTILIHLKALPFDAYTKRLFLSKTTQVSYNTSQENKRPGSKDHITSDNLIKSVIVQLP